MKIKAITKVHGPTATVAKIDGYALITENHTRPEIGLAVKRTPLHARRGCA